MQKLLSLVLTLLFLIAGSASAVLAQDASTPETDTVAPVEDVAFARGLDAAAIYFSDRGDTVATMKVVEIERGWEDYDEYYAPETGKEFVLVTIEVEMMARGGLVLSPYAFTMFDGFGYMNSTAYAAPVAEANIELMEGDITVASGETVQATIAFQVYEGAPLGYLIWQPGNGIGTLIDLTEADI